MKKHALVISGHLRFIEQRMSQLKVLSRECDIYVITNASQALQVDYLSSEVPIKVVFCEDVAWARVAEENEKKLNRRTIYQWIKYKLACQVIKQNESKYSRKYLYIHKIRTDCDYRNLEDLVGLEHCKRLDSLEGLFIETDYSWSGKREYALEVESMYEYFVNEIVNSQGRFRAKSINLLQLKASEINYWKVGAFITAIKEPDISYDEWVELVESLASKNLHDVSIKDAVIECYSKAFGKRYSEIYSLVSNPKYIEAWKRCKSDRRAAYNSLFFVRFLGNPTAPSEVAFAYFLNERGIQVCRAKPITGFLLK